MNTQILKKYDVNFYKSSQGEKFIDCKNTISSYLFVWRTIEDINDFLNDVELVLNGQFNSLIDPDYSDPLLKLYGELKSDNTISISNARIQNLSLPLIEFKELLLSWKEFLQE